MLNFDAQEGVKALRKKGHNEIFKKLTKNKRIKSLKLTEIKITREKQIWLMELRARKLKKLNYECKDNYKTV